MKSVRVRTRRVHCVRNAGYPVCLRRGKIYLALPDKLAERHKLFRVIDESGKDYLFPASYFVPAAVRRTARQG